MKRRCVWVFLWIVVLLAFAQGSRAGVLEELENAFSQVAHEVSPSVVSISTVQTYRVQEGYYVDPSGFSDKTLNEFFRRYFVIPPGTEFHRHGLGSGIIVRPDGYILTNLHVVQSASGMEVTLQDGRKFKAKLIGKDPRSDLAILKIEARDLSVAKLGDSSNVKIGQWVVAIGNPFGFLLKDTQATVTVGVVSATHRRLPDLGLGQGPYYYDLIQTDAAINPGNSGGPLVNLKGEVIGINMAIFSTSGGYEGLGFAVPINVAKGILDNMIQGEKVLYGWLGVGVGPVDDRTAKELNVPDQKGALVLKVFEKSAADKFKIKELDVIRKFGEKEIQTPDDLIQEVAKLKAGTTVKMDLIRKGEPIQIDVTLGPHPLENS
jgi:serine protease Do